MRTFLKNNKARIPFSVIGIFLIIGSSITTAYIGNLEKDKSQQISSTLDFNEVEQVLRYVESDISRSLSYSGLFALKTIGISPVISSKLDNDVSRDYADLDGDGAKDLDMTGDELDDSYQFNINYAKNITRIKLNEYLRGNFMDDRCNYLDYIINVKTDENKKIPVVDWREVTFEKITMKLSRNCGGVDDLMVTEDNKNYVTYWVAKVNLNITINNTLTGESRTFQINPTCIITSRLPIMIGLTDTFITTINGRENDLFGNKLCIFVTLISEGYTEARALIQWSQGPTKIKNIVDNEWLKFLTNSGLVMEEFMVFNSVDPMSLIELGRRISDLSGDDKTDLSTDHDGGLSVMLNLDNINDKMMEKIQDDINNSLAPGEKGYNKSELEGMINEAESKLGDNNMIKSVQYIAEDMLYEVDCSYYYHRRDLKDNPVDELYNICDLEDAYVKVFSEEVYKNKGVSFTDPDNSDYKYILGKPNADGEEDVVIRNVNEEQFTTGVKNIIETKIEKTYNATVQTDVTRSDYNDLGYKNKWSPDKSHGDKLIKEGSWNHVSSNPLGAYLEIKDTLPTGVYIEKWKVVFNRTDEYEICTDWDYKNNKCNSTKKEYHDYYQEHIVTFSIESIYQSDDVDEVFTNKKDIFNGETPHIISRDDDNLEEIRHVFPSYFVNNIRDDILQNRKKSSVSDKNYFYKDGEEYHIEWLKAKDGAGDNGCVVEALEEIIEMIKQDEQDYSNASKEYSGESNTLDTMDKGRLAMLNTFLGFKDKYNKEFFYHLNKDVSEDFISVGSKTVYIMRSWFTNEIQKKLEESKKDDFRDNIDDQIGSENAKKLNEYEQIQNDDDYKNVMKDLGNIGDGQGIQCGLAMNLERNKPGYKNWEEDIAFAIDREPNYFHFKPDASAKWEFNIKNICLGGPTGIPLLPIPPIPWFCTINLWSIEVDGCYEKFKLVDTLDETHASQLFGHDGQIYMRNRTKVKDIYSGKHIGDNNRIEFSFWTMNFAIVPPNRLPIGDQTGGIIEEN